MWLIILFGLFVSTAHCDLSIPLCPSGGEPVCAKSDYEFVYFENECKLNVYSYQRLFAGKSRPTKIALEECFSNCAGIICPRLYQPVCAQQIPEGTVSTVPNACLVNQLICETRKQWIILAKGICPKKLESGQSNNKAHAVPAVSYESGSTHQSTADHGTNTKLTHNAAPVPSADSAHTTAHHILQPYVSASNSPKYAHLLLASATSDKYTIAAYSAPVVAKESGTNSYQVSGSKSQQISYTSSGQSASPLESSAYHHSAPTPVSDSSHVSYAFGHSSYPSVVGSTDSIPSQPTYAASSKSPSESAAHPSQQNNYAESHQSSQQSANLYETTNSQSEQNSYESPVPAAVPSPTHYPPSAPASVSYPSEEPATTQYSSITGSPVAAPAPAMYEAPDHSSLPGPTSYSQASTHGSPSAESAHQVETTYPAPHSNDYQGSAQAAQPHYGNSQPLNHSPSPSYHAEIPQSVAHTNVNQDALQTTAAHYENSHPSTESSRQEAYSKDYPTAAQPDVAYYRNGQPTNEENSEYEDPQLSNQGSSYPENLYQTETPQTVANFNEGVAHPVQSHYESSQHLTQGSSASAGSYLGDTAHKSQHSNDYKEGAQTTPAHYENSHLGSASLADTYQGETSHSQQEHEPAHYGSTEPTNQGNLYPSHQASASPQDETAYPTSNTNEYQETAQANYENSEPRHHSSALPSESYQAETSHPPQYSNNHQPAVQAESDQYGNSHTSNHGSQPITDSYPSSEPLPHYYQGPLPTEEAHYKNSQPPQQGSSTVSESYPQLPASTDYQEPVENAPAQYENSDQERGPIAYSSSEYATTHLPSTSTCTEGDHIPTSHVSLPAPEPTPALTAPVPTSTAHTTSESYQGTIPYSEAQNSAPVISAPADQYSASPAYSNSVSSDSYVNPAPVSSESAYPESAHAPAATPSPDAVNYTPPEASYSKDSSDASHDLVAVPEQNSHKAAEVASEYAGPSAEPVQPENQYKAPDSSTNSLPTQETYSHPAQAVNPTYSAPEEYIFQVTHLHKPGNKTSVSSSAPHVHQTQKSKHHHSPISSLNIYLAPAAAAPQAHASAPAVHVYTIPYRYPLSAPSTPSLSSPAQAPVDIINPTEEISEAYDPKLADLVSKWVDRNEHTEYLTNNGYSLGVPFYYQPSFTLIQYNSAKSQHSKK